MKDKTTAGILALTLGVFGVHRFYLRQPFLGILYIFLPPISAVLGVIDGILLLTMDQDDFDAKYNQRKGNRNAYRRERRAKRHAKRRNNRQSQSRVKPRHRVASSTVTTNRDRTERAKRKVAFKKIFAQAQKYFKDYQFDEAEKSYLKALRMAPDHPQLLYELACLYAMKEETAKGFEYLELAVHKGFKDLDDIDTNPSLAYLRIQDEFLDFAKAGYKRTQKEEHGVELLEQLRQLDILKSRGLLTELEFEAERKKLLH